MRIIEIRNLKKYFPLRKFGKRYYVRAVDDVSFSIEEGEIVGILGESGSGKTTLGFLISRLERETEGNMFFRDQKISGTLKLSKDIRRRIQLILQNPYDSFDPRFTVGESLFIPLKTHKVGSQDSEWKDKIYEYMEISGLSPAKDYYERYPHELSGGQLQRLSILRAMLLNPDFLVADECVSMLDVSVRADIINFLLNFISRSKTSMMFITHDISLANFVSNRIIVMYLGKVMEIAKAEEIVKNPLHPYTRILISYSPTLLEKKGKIPIKGYVQPLMETPKGCRFLQRCSFAKKECSEIEPELVEVEKDHFVACHETLK
jgi:peptide/nickel transport system ATP-binding protein